MRKSYVQDVQLLNFGILIAALLGWGVAGLLFVDSSVGSALSSNLRNATLFTAAIGGFVGAILGFVSIWFHDYRRRRIELNDLRISIYTEIADRAARCANDYISPWKNVGQKSVTKFRRPYQVRKFLPSAPIVYPGNAAKLGILSGDTIFAVYHFYFRLEALTREMEELASLCERADVVLPDSLLQSRLMVITRRMHRCFKPALSALKALDIEKAPFLDAQSASEYEQLHESGLKLRDALKQFSDEVAA